MVDAMHRQFGAHPGCRAIHARGIWLEGTFTSSGAVATYSTSAFFALGTSPVLARFSNGDGNPDAADATGFSFGFAVRFSVPGGETFDLLCVDSSTFITDDPGVFLKFVEASIPQPGHALSAAAKFAAFGVEHPRVLQHVLVKLRGPVPASFAQAQWWAVHTFDLEQPNRPPAAELTPVRFSWQPVAGVRPLERKQAEPLSRCYLAEELTARIAQGPAEFDLVVTVGTADDSRSPMQDWPADRTQVIAGRLRLTAIVASADPLRFNPLTTPAGIRPPSDLLVAGRSLAYAASFAYRCGTK
jgi:catalase